MLWLSDQINRLSLGIKELFEDNIRSITIKNEDIYNLIKNKFKNLKLPAIENFTEDEN